MQSVFVESFEFVGVFYGIVRGGTERRFGVCAELCCAGISV